MLWINKLKNIIMEFIKTTEQLPKSELLNDNKAVYFLIKIKDFGNQLAMFLENENGEKGWYSDYTSKIFREVNYWCEIPNELKQYNKTDPNNSIV